MTEPGWYTDPRDSSQYRYWDGTAWTEAVAPGAAAGTFAGEADGSDLGQASSDAATDVVEASSDIATDHLDDGPDAVTQRIPLDSIDTPDHSTASDVSTASDLSTASDISNAASGGLSVDEALLGFDRDEGPAPELGDIGSSTLDVSGLDDSIPDVPKVTGFGHDEGFSEGVSVDEVLGEVTDPLDEAFEAASAKATDLTDNGIPGDGVSFTSPIDGFGPADQTAVIPGPGAPFAGPDAADIAAGFGTDPGAEGFPPPPPGGAGFGNGMADPSSGFGGAGEFPDPESGFGAATPGYGGSPPPDQFGTVPPAGGFDGRGPDFGPGQLPDDLERSAGPRPLTPPTVVPSKSRTPWVVLGVIGLAVVAILLFLAIRAPGSTSVDSISIGQCFADFDQFDATEIRSSVSSAECDEEHALEVFAVTDDPYRDFEEYPGEDVIKDLAFRHCLDGFEAFVGTAYGDSALDVWALYPTDGSWNLNGDREVVCMVGAFDKSLTVGTLQGSGR